MSICIIKISIANRNSVKPYQYSDAFENYRGRNSLASWNQLNIEATAALTHYRIQLRSFLMIYFPL